MALDGGTPRLRHRPTVGCLLKTVFGCRLGAAARPTADSRRARLSSRLRLHSRELVTASPEAVICSRTVTWSKEPYRHACEGQAVDLPTSFTAHEGSQPAVRAFMRCVAVILSPRRDVDQTAAVGTAESDAANDIRKEENGL